MADHWPSPKVSTPFNNFFSSASVQGCLDVLNLNLFGNSNDCLLLWGTSLEAEMKTVGYDKQVEDNMMDKHICFVE